MLACAGLAFLDPTSPARALADAMQGVASRDIKLENTLLDNSPRPLIKLADFGCEWRRGRDPLHAGGPRGGGKLYFFNDQHPFIFPMCPFCEHAYPPVHLASHVPASPCAQLLQGRPSVGGVHARGHPGLPGARSHPVQARLLLRRQGACRARGCAPRTSWQGAVPAQTLCR